MSTAPAPNTSLRPQGLYKDKPLSKSSQVDVGELKQHIGEMADRVEKLPPPKPKAATSAESDTTDYVALLQKARVRPTDVITKPVGCWAIGEETNQMIVGTLGNLSTIIGKAKTKKTFAVTIAVAAVLASKLILNRITGLLGSDSVVLFFDTEQSRYHVLRIVRRICKLAGIDDPDNLQVYSLRPFSPDERLAIIDWALNNTPNLSMAVIDGVRDLAVDPVTDSEDASVIMTHLLKWTDELNIHILTVLHQNKNDTNARGHLGTELVNKSETVISISRDSTDKEVSVVAPEYCRDREFEEFRFSVDETGLPFLINENPYSNTNVLNTSQSGSRSTKPTIDTMTSEEVLAIIERAFAQDSQLKYSQLLTNLIEASEFIGVALAKSRAEQFIRRAVVQNQIVKFTPAKSAHSLYKLPLPV